MNRVPIRVAIATACSLALSLGGLTAAHGADNRDPGNIRNQVTISATVVDEAGNPVNDSYITVGALPIADRAGDLIFDTIGSAVTDPQGRATLNVSIKDAARYLGVDGAVDLMISAQNADGSQGMAFSIPAYPTATDWQTPIDGNSILPAAAVEKMAQANASRASLSQVALQLADNPAPATSTAGDSVDEASATDFSTAALPFRACKTNEVEALVATSYYASKWLPVKRVETRALSRMKYEWQTSNNTKFTVALNGAYGGLAASSLQTSSAGYIYTSTTNANRNLEVQWQYRQYDVRCYDAYLGVYTADTGKDSWRPYKWTGGTQTIAVSGTQFTCNGSYLTNMTATTWVAQSTTTTHSNGATLTGVSLTQQQTSSSSHKLSVIPNTGATAKVCGSNNYPIYAAKVKEI